MSAKKVHFRVVTYNTHKSRGMDGRVRPERIAKVLKELNPDIVALQEVLNISGKGREKDQARYFAEELGFHFCVGRTRDHRGGIYGNVLLTKFPLRFTENYDISIYKYEQRGCLRVDLELPHRHIVHVFNVHLGVDYFERRGQARKLMDAAILHNPDLAGPRIVLGDFNEWTLGITTRMLRKHFECLDTAQPKKRIKTYPGVLPVLALDHIYYERETLRLKNALIFRSRTARMASDHLPMVADIEIG